MIKWLASRATVLFTVVILLSSAAYADAFRLRIEDVGTGQGVVITDNATGDLAPGQSGWITWSGVLGAFGINVTTGVSKPNIGGFNNYAELDLNSVNITYSGAGTIRITLEDQGYTLGPDGQIGLVSTVGGTLTAPPGSTAAFQSWVNPSNAVLDFGADSPTPSALVAMGALPSGSVSVFPTAATFGPGAYSIAGSNEFIKAGTYSLFSQATLHLSGSGSVSFDQNTSAVPEPASLVLLGSGLIGIGLVARKRKAAQAQPQA